MTHFDVYRKEQWEANSLFLIRHQDPKLLRDYMARFNMAALEVYNLDESMAMLAMKRGVRTS